MIRNNLAAVTVLLSTYDVYKYCYSTAYSLILDLTVEDLVGCWWNEKEKSKQIKEGPQQ